LGGQVAQRAHVQARRLLVGNGHHSHHVTRLLAADAGGADRENPLSTRLRLLARAAGGRVVLD
ncbi:MAG: hypothetical protein JWP24_25, partial [Marmoricola sp.]|nr:hypothetical protein [Marmoricola sp.]